MLGAAFTAGLSLTLIVVDSSGDEPDAQRIVTDDDAAGDPADEGFAADDAATVVALADVADRSLLRVVDPDGEAGAPAAAGAGAEPAGTGGDDTGTPGTISVDGSTAAGTVPSTGAPAGGAIGATDGSTGRGSSPSPSTAATTPQPTAGSGSGTGSGGNGASTTRPPTTAAPTTARPPTTAAPTTTSPPTTAPTTRPSGGNGGGQFESIRNRDPLFGRFANVPSAQLPMNELTIPTSQPDNGAHPHGNFRMACAYSHFAYDDPIVFPGQPGRSHLHMFFGNTAVDANTTTDSLVNSGGSSCNGFELNRSGYWTPAVHDGKGNLVVPDQIILYYKTTMPSQTVAMPQGLKMVVGNTTSESFTASQRLGWSCGASGTSYNRSNRIPNNCGNDPINAYVQFPNCWDGRNLDSSDHISHMYFANDNETCPSSHPVRLPQITILLYFPAGNTSGWYLSSDRSGGFNTGPGATLHADWFGGWNDDAMDLWINGCIRASRNCSYGQTGTSRMFAKLNNLQNYPGNNFLPMP